MEDVNSDQNLKNAVDLIQQLGGKVHFVHPTILVWGQEFKSLKQISEDPRCEVNYATLYKRYRRGVPIAEAVVLSNGRRGKSKTVTCWGETFASLWELGKDPRCLVCYHVLTNRISKGMKPEVATSILPTRKPITTIDQVILKGKRCERSI
jgi:hypothetical protein